MNFVHIRPISHTGSHIYATYIYIKRTILLKSIYEIINVIIDHIKLFFIIRTQLHVTSQYYINFTILLIYVTGNKILAINNLVS